LTVDFAPCGPTCGEAIDLDRFRVTPGVPWTRRKKRKLTQHRLLPLGLHSSHRNS
jgi:hypothetical protein